MPNKPPYIVYTKPLNNKGEYEIYSVSTDELLGKIKGDNKKKYWEAFDKEGNYKYCSERKKQCMDYFRELDKERIMAQGGGIGFEKLSKQIAKKYEGDKVAPKYQHEYGKTYSKSEAQEVGDKVAGKVYWQQQGRKFGEGGEVSVNIEETFNEIKKEYPRLETSLLNGKMIKVIGVGKGDLLEIDKKFFNGQADLIKLGGMFSTTFALYYPPKMEHGGEVEDDDDCEDDEYGNGGSMSSGMKTYYIILNDGSQKEYTVANITEIPNIYFSFGRDGLEKGTPMVHYENALNPLFNEDGTFVNPIPEYAGKDYWEFKNKMATGGNTTFYYDQAKKTLGETLYNHIASLNEEQLEKHLSRLQKEIERMKAHDTEYTKQQFLPKLKQEEKFILYRLERLDEFKYAQGGNTNLETIELKYYNIHNQVIQSGKVTIDYSNETITLGTGKTYKVEPDRYYTYKFLKNKIKASGGINGLAEYLKEINDPSNPSNTLVILFLEEDEKKADGGNVEEAQEYYRVFRNNAGKDVAVKILKNPIFGKYDYYVDGTLRGQFDTFAQARQEVNYENFDMYKDGGNIYSKDESINIARTILQQMGGRARLEAFTGAYNFAVGDGAVMFRIKNRGVNFVKVKLNGSDLYDVTFGRVSGTNFKVVEQLDDIYAEDLIDIFEKSTGMYLRFEDGGMMAKGGGVFNSEFYKDGGSIKKEKYAYVQAKTTSGKNVFKFFEKVPTHKEVYAYFRTVKDEHGNPITLKDATIHVEEITDFDRELFLEKANEVAISTFGSPIKELDDMMFSFDKNSLSVFKFEAELENGMEVSIQTLDGVIVIEAEEEAEDKFKDGGSIDINFKKDTDYVKRENIKLVKYKNGKELYNWDYWDSYNVPAEKDELFSGIYVAHRPLPDKDADKQYSMFKAGGKLPETAFYIKRSDIDSVVVYDENKGEEIEIPANRIVNGIWFDNERTQTIIDRARKEGLLPKTDKKKETKK